MFIDSFRPSVIFRGHVFLVGIFLTVLANTAFSEMNFQGQSGLVNMPNARITEDGTLHFGYSENLPYNTGWANISFLPWLELSGRYTEINDIAVFGTNNHFGDFKDKAFDIKFQVLRESNYFPAVAMGVLDYTGTRLFAAEYLNVSKKLHHFDFTLGVGNQRMSGIFGGVRYKSTLVPGLQLLLEHDNTDYENDPFAFESGAVKRRGGPTLGVEYALGWWDVMLSVQRNRFDFGLSLSVPMMVKEYVPKIDEPEPFNVDHLTLDPLLAVAPDSALTLIVQTLQKASFSHVVIEQNDDQLSVSFNHDRTLNVSKLMGRAARIVNALKPKKIKTFDLTYVKNRQPIVKYRFEDLERLNLFFEQGLTNARLSSLVSVYSPWSDFDYGLRREIAISPKDPVPKKNSVTMLMGEDGDPVKLRFLKSEQSVFNIVPFNASFFFNDPSGALHYDTFVRVDFKKDWGLGYELSARARLTLFEDVSKVSQPSNSLLPHVRTNIAEYHREANPLRLSSLMVRKYWRFKNGLYGLTRLGIYENMFGGVGTQVLGFLNRNWSVDVDVNWLKQRKIGSEIGFDDYQVSTWLASVHYRFPWLNLQPTLRVGRFLAKDNGVRFELKRTFKNGAELGFWVTKTDGKDITSPGSPDNPYDDKGVFFNMPLNVLLTKDSKAVTAIRLSPWTRDVGQSVISHDDLFRWIEKPLEFNKNNRSFLDSFLN